MIREQAALKCAKDILGNGASEEEIALAASIIIHDVTEDEKAQQRATELHAEVSKG